MRQKFQTRAKFKKFTITATAKLLIIFFVLGLNVVPLPVSSDNARVTDGNYIIKFADLRYYSQLTEVASSIKRRFSASQEREFKNIYTFKSAYALADLKNRLAGGFDYLEAQKFVSAAGVVVNDPGFTGDSQNIDKEWGLIKAGFNNAWEKTTGSNGNVVAIVDTGIDETHEDLKAVNYVNGFDFVANMPIARGVNSDDNGHGTLVAGILGATVNNGLGIAGTNWQISLMPIKALDAAGKGDVAAVSEALVWAADHGAGFINLSLGGIGFGHDTTLANAVAYAFNKNAVIVSAAGNDAAAVGGNLDLDPVFPICDDNNYNMIIGVAATDFNDTKPAFSNYGKNCVDVTAPGKRILSAINFDPLTKKSSPNSYAYASGTSLAVPFVVGEAALIKALYPQATNIQIRDRIISSADPIDNLNLSQCAGGSCRGLLGAGRINVSKGLQTVIAPQFVENDLIKVSDLSGAIYQIVGGQKRLVSSFVHNQRFVNSDFKTAIFNDLSGFLEGPYVTPIDGTLVKYDLSPTVYFIQNGQKLPITYKVFKQRQLSFLNVSTLSVSELDSWPAGSFLAPAEGTLLKTPGSKTVYWVVGQVLHPINYKFFAEKGLNIFPILAVSDAEVSGFAKGEAYIR